MTLKKKLDDVSLSLSFFFSISFFHFYHYRFALSDLMISCNVHVTCLHVCVYVYVCACTKRVTRKLARTCFTIVESFLFLFNHFFFSPNVFLADIYIFTLNHLRRRPITYATDGRTLYTYTLDIWFYLSNVPMRTSIIEKIRDRTRYTIMNTTCMRGNITLFNAVERL